eukprot:763006-Prymnesium_polylepis.1
MGRKERDSDGNCQACRFQRDGKKAKTKCVKDAGCLPPGVGAAAARTADAVAPAPPPPGGGPISMDGVTANAAMANLFGVAPSAGEAAP